VCIFDKQRLFWLMRQNQWCSRDRNDRDRAQISRCDRDRDLEVRDRHRDLRRHISLMVIKTNSLKNTATKYLAHCQKYQDNKNHPKFVQTARSCKRSFSLSS